MAFVDYTLANLRLRLQNEFAIPTGDATSQAILDEKINDAQSFICSRRENWPWMKLRHVIDTVAATSGTGDVTKGSRSVPSLSFTGIPRRVLTTEASGTSPTTGYLITAFSGGTATLDQQFLGTTAVGATLRMVETMFQLPDDFIRSEGPPIVLDDDAFSDEAQFVDPERFQREEHRNTPDILNRRIYTVVRDPLNLEERKYLRIYPYLTELSAIRLTYHRDIPSLVSGGDVPIIPRNNRLVLLHVAQWFVAAWRGAETAQIYRDVALRGLEEMTNEYELVDDASEFVHGYEPDFILPPSGYEDFDRSW